MCGGGGAALLAAALHVGGGHALAQPLEQALAVAVVHLWDTRSVTTQYTTGYNTDNRLEGTDKHALHVLVITKLLFYIMIDN